MIQAVAWVVLVLNAIVLTVEPFYFGRPKGNYGPISYLSQIFGACLAVPLCGRVLGWW